MIDEYTRECLAIDVRGAIRSHRVLELLAKLACVAGAPRYLRSDNGPAFVSRGILLWLNGASMETAASDPCMSWQNGWNESFNGNLPDDCPSMKGFRNRTDARNVIEDRRQDDNAVRLHSSLNSVTPTEFATTT